MSFLILARDFGLFEYFSSVINFKPFLWTLVTTVLNSQLCNKVLVEILIFSYVINIVL